VMCRYVAAGIADPVVREWAEHARAQYGRGSQDPLACCWAAYWLAKHSVEFSRDEPRLYMMGETDKLDMLISPAVLVRSPRPKEDCDGFTMLLCSMLKILGVDCCIVTVAVDPTDRARWSHVFPMALFPDGSRLPLDASHGTFPGWMVPRSHIFRWQAWGLDGQPIDVPMPATGSGLHGYVRRGRGMGQDDSGGGFIPTSAPNPTDELIYNLPGTITGNPGDLSSLPLNPGGPVPAVASPPSAPATNWTSVLNSLISGASKVATVAELPVGSSLITNPQTGAQSVVSGAYPYSTSALTSSLSGLLPILGIGLLVFLVVSAAGKHK
jgi:hypothetical protein